MAGYKGGADQTVIAAAKSAYTIPEGYVDEGVDYTKFIEGMAKLATFITGKVGEANERKSKISGFEEEINKEFWSANNTDYFTNLKQTMFEASKTMSMSLPFSEKYKDAERIWTNGMASLNALKADETVLEEWIKGVNSAVGPEQSGFNNPMLKSLMAEIQGGSGVFENSIRFTDDGIVVMGPNGEEIDLDELPNITLKTDGSATHDLVNAQITEAITFKTQGNWDDRNRYIVRQNISSFLDKQNRGAIGSAAFDYEHLTADGSISFADYLMETSGELNTQFNAWKETPEGLAANETTLKEMKYQFALNLWDDDLKMKDEYLDFVMDQVLDYQVEGTSVSSNNKQNNNRKSTNGDDDFTGDDPRPTYTELSPEQKEEYNFDKIIATSGRWWKHSDNWGSGKESSTYGKTVLSDQILDYRDDDFVAATLYREYSHLGFDFNDSGNDLITATFVLPNGTSESYEFETNFVGGGGENERKSGRKLIAWMEKMMIKQLNASEVEVYSP